MSLTVRSSTISRNSPDGVRTAIRNVYFVVFGILLNLAEFSHANETLASLLSPVSFLNSTVGRGIFSLYLGTMLFDPSKVWDLIISLCLMANGGFNIIAGICECDGGEEDVPPKALEGGSAAFIPPASDAAPNADYRPSEEAQWGK